MRPFPSAGLPLLALCACLCAAAARGGDAPPPAKTNSPAAGSALAGPGYTIRRPDGWSVREGAMPQVDLAMTCDADPLANISVVRAPAGGEGEITEKSAREMKEMFAASLPGYAVTAEEWREVGGARAYRLSARYALRSGKLSMAMQNSQALFVAGDTVFTITYTSTPELFMKHLGDFEAALDGFRLQAAETPAAAAGRAPAARTP